MRGERTGKQPFFCFKVKRQVHLQARSTAKSANREKSNSRLNPDESGSPVDLGCRIPAKCAFFTQKKRILKTKDSLAEQSEFELSVPII
jgi:hypothetical protein